MRIAPLEVLMLGWDVPAAATAAPAATSALITALAPHAALTLLLPHLPEAMHLPAPSRATALSNLSTQELGLTGARSSQQARPATWQSPAAPYLGASAEDSTGGSGPGPARPAAPYVGRSELAPATTEASAAAATPETAEQHNDDPAAATLLNPDAFVADNAEPDAQEAAALPEAPATTQPTASALAAAATSAAASTAVVPVTASPAPVVPVAAGSQSVLALALEALRTEPTDDASLNFRVIQYARLATRLATGQAFAVIYAADWQTWLAGLELRQLTGKPLVLHVHSLAQDRNTAADRGWGLELERQALRRADLVLTASPALATRVLELHGLPPQRVRFLPVPALNDGANHLNNTILAALREASAV